MKHIDSFILEAVASSAISGYTFSFKLNSYGAQVAYSCKEKSKKNKNKILLFSDLPFHSL